MSENKKQQLVPRLRFPEYRAEDGWGSEFGNMIFDQISNKDHNSDLPVLAITQEQGAIPREMIDYHVSVTDKSLESYKVVEVGDFIISLRSFQGGIEFSRYRGICSPAYVILRLRHGHSEDYFRHYLKTGRFIAQMTKNLEGLRDGKMISYKQFSELELPIPQRGEQQKIADCLSSLDDLIAAETDKLDTLKTHKKGLMQQLFPSEGETVPRLRFPEFREAGEWKPKTIGNSCESFSGGTPSTTNKSFYGGEIPFIRSAEIDKVKTELFLTNEGLENSAAKLVRAGDILVALYGANSGDVALSKINGAINQAILCLRHETSDRFVYQYLSHKKEWIIATFIQGGQGNLSGEIIKAISLFFPNPSEQEHIADCLSSLDDLITAQTQKIDAIKIHKKGLIQQLFPVLDEVPA
ncbi:restriction endonuclease subunit S [Morganella morganii]|uniref:restriction endonuclease subunit S n=1 Tax=Morganella morganii TaxID=582 RepID=UPI001F50D5D0|nr:restriction endonuclease subunit S [Morganella morganii]